MIIDGDVHIENLQNFQFQGSDILLHRSVSEDVQQYGFDSFGEEDNIPYLESSTKLVCSNPSNFYFKEITNLSLLNITILNCGSWTSEVGAFTAVYMNLIYNLEMDGFTIKNSTGYGLIGRNLLGITMITRSSFVGSNQCAKKFQFQISGGNVVLIHNNDVETTTSNGIHHLIISNALFTLGYDATEDYDPIACRTMGSGLGILFDYNLYETRVVINSSILYRNHAQDGSNLKIFVIETPANLCNIEIHNISSIRGTSFSRQEESTVLYVVISEEVNPPSYTRTFNITDSEFINSQILLHMSEIDQIYYDFRIKNCAFINTNIKIEDKYYYQHYGYLGFHLLYQVVFAETKLMNSHLVINYVSFYLLQSCIVLDSSITLYSTAANLSGNCQFINNLQRIAPLNLVNSPEVIISGNFEFLNCSSAVGGAIYLESSLLQIKANVTLANNKALYDGGAIYMKNSRIEMDLSDVTFVNNNANLNGGAIYMHSSVLNLKHQTSVSFIGNVAYISGGAIYIDDRSALEIYGVPHISFVKNVAQISGGAIYVLDLLLADRICFLTVNDHNHLKMYFNGNYAKEAGSVLYGGNIDTCRYEGFDLFNTIASIGFHDKSTSLISSDPNYICPCNDTVQFPQTDPCSITSINKTIYPGQTILVQFITIGQRNGASPSIVLNYRAGGDGISFVSAMRSSKQCEEYKVPFGLVNSSQYLVTQALFSTGNFKKSFFNISITVLPCPVGFLLNTASITCECDHFLPRFGITCNISDMIIQGTKNKWIGYTSQHILGFCDICPFDYCTEAAKVNVLDLNSQCNYNRINVLCGQCQDGLSMTFGTSQCKVCTNYYLLMIAPFAIMGITLVLVLFVLNLTVSSGTLNGLLFYANIVRINDSIFFSRNRNFAAQFIATFIAWLNLDIGMESCFYDGMDSYAKTWLQFAFPTYLFSLLGAIVVAGRCSSKISRLCRHNVIPVLSTLILLSYSKILRTIITIFSFSVIDTETNSTVLVWLYDGNVKFLGSKHSILFTFGFLVLLAFVIPYTTMLLFLPCLQSKSHLKIFLWVNKLKPFLDSYAAPYKDRYRFWAGVLLLFRLPLYLLFASTNSTPVHPLGILIFVNMYSMLLIRLQVYKKWTTFILEIFFHLNIISISTASLFDLTCTQNIQEPIAILVLIGVASAFVCFVIIVATHIYMRSGKVMPSWKMCRDISALWKGKDPNENARYEITSLNINNSTDGIRETLLQN